MNNKITAKSALIVILLFLCFIVVASFNAKTWLFGYFGMDLPCEFTCPRDAVVVLGSGYFFGVNHLSDRLDQETILRVNKGVEVFKRCDIPWLVLSGSMPVGPKVRLGELMRDLAVRMGVPQEHVLLEVDSINTRDHPMYLKNIGLFGSNSSLAIVTSPWHLRRSMIEFRRYFPLVIPVGSYCFPSECAVSFSAWLPQLVSLDSRTLFHELIGMMWYDLLDWFSIFDESR